MNLKAFVAAIMVIPSILPLVDQTVKSVESAFADIPGADKFKAAEAKVNTYLEAAIQDVTILTNLKQILKPLIDGAVAAFNAAGIFKHKTTEDAAAKPVEQK